jgi:hypothetical protein
MDQETLGTPLNEEESLETQDQEETTTPQDEQEEEVESEEETGEEEAQDFDEDKYFDEVDPYNDEPPMPDDEEAQVVQEETTEAEPQENAKGVLITKPLKYKGKEIFVNNEDEAIALMQKGLDYEVKMSKLKPLRGIAKIVEESGIEQEDIQALADAKQGKAEALEYLAKKFGLERAGANDDDLGIFDEEEPKANDYKPVAPQEDPIKEILVSVSERDPELYGRVVKTFDELDPTFQQEVYDPRIFPLFVGSVASGEWDKTYPIAVKIKAVNPALSWLQAYQAAAQEVVQLDKQKKEPPKRKRSRKPAKRNVEYDDLWDKDLDELEKELGL